MEDENKSQPLLSEGGYRHPKSLQMGPSTFSHVIKHYFTTCTWKRAQFALTVSFFLVLMVTLYSLYILETSCYAARYSRQSSFDLTVADGTPLSIYVSVQPDRITAGNVTLKSTNRQDGVTKITAFWVATTIQELDLMGVGLTRESYNNYTLYVNDAYPRDEPVSCRRIAIVIEAPYNAIYQDFTVTADSLDINIHDLGNILAIDTFKASTQSGHVVFDSIIPGPKVDSLHISTDSGHCLFHGYFHHVAVSSVSGDIHGGIVIMDDSIRSMIGGSVSLYTKTGGIDVKRLDANNSKISVSLDGSDGTSGIITLGAPFKGSYLLRSDIGAVISVDGDGITNKVVSSVDNDVVISGVINGGGSGEFTLTAKGNNIARLQLTAQGQSPLN